MPGDWARLGLVAGCAGAAGAALLPLLRRLALRLDATIWPRHDRAHTQATPYLGGVGHRRGHRGRWPRCSLRTGRERYGQC